MKTNFTILLLINVCFNALAQENYNKLTADTLSGNRTLSDSLNDAFNRLNPGLRIDSDEISLTGVYHVTDALQGRVSGMDVISTYNGPGSGFEAIIRSQSALRNDLPLIVIDGVPQIRNSMVIAPYSENKTGIFNPIPIAIEDIASISILKNAAATAFYGSEGVNGILLIETKNSKPGKLNIDYGYTYGHSFKPATLPMLSGEEYAILQLEALYNRYGVFEIPPELSYDQDFEDFFNYSANTNWVKEVTRAGQTQNHYIGINGTLNKTNYGITFNHMDQTGNIISTGYNHNMIHAKLNHRFSEKLSVALQSRITNRNYDDNFQVENEHGKSPSILEMAYMLAPNRAVWEYDSDGDKTGEYFTPIMDYQGSGLEYYNPVAVANLSDANKKVNESTNTLTLSYKPLKWLRFSEQAEYTAGTWDYSAFLPYNAIGTFWSTNYTSSENQTIDYKHYKNRMGIFISNPERNNVHLFSIGGIWLLEYNVLENYLQKRNSSWVPPQTTDPSTGPIIPWVEAPFMTKRFIHSGIASADYQLLEKYFLSTTFRVEKPNVDGTNHQTNTFLGISTGWRFSKERFLESLSFLNNGVINLGYGNKHYQLVYDYNSSLPDVKTNELFGEIDLKLFKNRLDIKTYLFTHNITHTYALNHFTTSSDYNTRGFEGMVEYLAINNKKWQASFNCNVGYLKRKFTALPSSIATTSSGRNYQTVLQPGSEIGTIFGLNYLGVYSSDDDAISYDANGEIITDASGDPINPSYINSYLFVGGDARYADQDYNAVINNSDFIYLGHTTPDYIGGFGSKLRYNNFELNLQFHYRLGYKIINNMALFTSRTDSRTNQSKAVLSRWRVQGQDEPGILPRGYLYHPANYLPSDKYIESGNSVELNYCSLAYQIPKKAVNKMKMKSLTLGLSVRRLFSISRYSGFDTEISRYYLNVNEHPKDDIRLPSPKVISFSVNVGF